MATNIYRNGAKAVIKNGTANAVSLPITSLLYNAGATNVRFYGQGLTAVQVLYTDLTVNGVSVINRADAIAKLNALFPEIIMPFFPVTNDTQRPPKKFYGTHMMMALSHHTGNVTTYVQNLKSLGYNVVWAHCDDYSNPAAAYYETNLAAVITACETVGGIWVIPGFMNWATTGATTGTNKARNLITDCWNRAGVLRINGKRVYAAYNYAAHGATFNQVDLHTQLLDGYGINKKDWLLIANSQYPYFWDQRLNAQGYAVYANDVPGWNITGFKSLTIQAPDYTITDMNFMLDNWPWVDGLMVFAGDMPLSMIRAENLNLSEVANSRELKAGSWAGSNAWYQSFTFYDYGLDGIANMGQDIINMPVDMRPMGWMSTTANDFAELSYSAIATNEANGIFYVPDVSAGYKLGGNIRAPLLAHQGWEQFMKPWVDAFLTEQQAAYFPSNELFCFYMPHDKNAAFIPVIPALQLAAGYVQSDWDTQPGKAGSAQVTGIKAIAGVDDIRLGAWIAPNQSVYLKINATLSGLFTVGANGGYATFRIPLAGFTGTPVFSMIASNGVTVIKTANGTIPITGTCEVGQWNIICKKL